MKKTCYICLNCGNSWRSSVELCSCPKCNSSFYTESGMEVVVTRNERRGEGDLKSLILQRDNLVHV